MERNKVHKGIGYARNYLLRHFNTPYACWLDSDDVIHPKRIEKQLQALQSQSADILFSPLVVFVRNISNTKGGIIADVTKYSDWNSIHYNTCMPSGFFSSELKKYEFNPHLTLGGEDILWLYQLVRSKKKIGYLDENLYFYRKHIDRIGRIKLLGKNKCLREMENIIIQREVEKLNRV